MTLRRMAGAAWRWRIQHLPLNEFEHDVARVQSHTMLGLKRLQRLHRAVRETSRARVPGDVVECGVARGGSAALLGRAMAREVGRRRLWLFDSFEGMPEPSRERDPDYEEAAKFVGACKGDETEVRALLERECPRVPVTIVAGRYERTLAEAQLPERVAVLHVDCDWYDPVKLVLETFRDRLSPDAIVQIDDYWGWEGCRRAVDEFLEGGPWRPLYPIDGSAVWFSA